MGIDEYGEIAGEGKPSKQIKKIMCKVEFLIDPKAFIAKVESDLNGTREYRNESFEEVLEQVILDLQEEFFLIAQSPSLLPAIHPGTKEWRCPKCNFHICICENLRLCLNCGQQIQVSFNTCPHCGRQGQQDRTRMCLGCGQNIQANYKVCPHCGKIC